MPFGQLLKGCNHERWQLVGPSVGPDSASYSLCDLGQVLSPLWAQVSSQYVEQRGNMKSQSLLCVVKIFELEESMYHITSGALIFSFF